MGSDPLVNHFLKAVFTARPCVPRYQSIWDTSLVLSYLKTFAPVESSNIKDLTLKLVMLIALVTGQRCQSIYLMDLDSMQKNEDHYKFVIGDVVKQSAPDKKQPKLILPAFNPLSPKGSPFDE